jgi:hypothetical protein
MAPVITALQRRDRSRQAGSAAPSRQPARPPTSPPLVVTDTSDSGVLIELVAEQLGIAVLPRSAPRPAAKLSQLRLSRAKLGRRILLVWRPSDNPPAARRPRPGPAPPGRPSSDARVVAVAVDWCVQAQQHPPAPSAWRRLTMLVAPRTSTTAVSHTAHLHTDAHLLGHGDPERRWHGTANDRSADPGRSDTVALRPTHPIRREVNHDATAASQLATAAAAGPVPAGCRRVRPGRCRQVLPGRRVFGPSYAVKFVGWGYPAWFRFVVGAGKLLSAALLFVPRTRFVGRRDPGGHPDRRGHHPHRQPGPALPEHLATRAPGTGGSGGLGDPPAAGLPSSQCDSPVTGRTPSG